MTEKENKGITGISETARGFLGRNPQVDKTKKDGKTRIRFQIACGHNQPERYKYAIWRYCIAYGDVADGLTDIRKGSLVKVRGWLTCEVVRDDNGFPVIHDGVPEKREYLILYEGVELEHTNGDNQLTFETINEPVLSGERG